MVLNEKNSFAVVGKQELELWVTHLFFSFDCIWIWSETKYLLREILSLQSEHFWDSFLICCLKVTPPSCWSLAPFFLQESLWLIENMFPLDELLLQQLWVLQVGVFWQAASWFWIVQAWTWGLLRLYSYGVVPEVCFPKTKSKNVMKDFGYSGHVCLLSFKEGCLCKYPENVPDMWNVSELSWRNALMMMIPH